MLTRSVSLITTKKREPLVVINHLLFGHLTYAYSYNNSFEVQSEKFKKKATGLLRNFLEDWVIPENFNMWQGNFTDETSRLLVETDWI